ncbi:MAG: hypothetical protein Q8M76_16715 [Spirochaetaceae bacterium]|nr:hypothetical protein [Spirochaetaceae bacterium]
MAKVDLELADLRLSKGEIEAKIELDRVNAQATYVSAQDRYLKAVLANFNEVIDTAYAAATADIDASVAALTLENSRDDRKYAELRYKNGLLSEEDFLKADIAYRTNASSQETVALTAQDARDAVLLTLGMEWKAELLPEVPDFEPKGTKDEWVALDPALRAARLAERAAELKTAALSSNAASFDRRIQETEFAKAKATAVTAEGDAMRAYDGILRLLKSQKAALQIRRDDFQLKSSTYLDAQRRFEKGAISQSDKNSAKIAELNARKTLLVAQQSYIKSIGKYQIYLGKDPTVL